LRSATYKPLPTVKIRRLPSSHPAAREALHTAGDTRGLFAQQPLPEGTWIGDYTGVVKPQVAEDRSRYLMEMFCDPVLDLRLDVRQPDPSP
jgi:hypothetical protein